MSQLAKTVYFSDYPRAATGRSGLTIPFPDCDVGAFTSVAHLSSYAIRELIGYESFTQLEQDARNKELSTATFARDLLIQKARVNGVGDRDDYRHALQATFRGGRGSPLHEWYPYLEGYSPDFVNSIIDTFCPAAETILDPFCGSGTTALIAALRGKRGLYAEINPVCRYVTSAKLAAVRLPQKTRNSLSVELERLADNLSRLEKTSRPCTTLKDAFLNTFGESKFFSDGVFDQVLRLRSLTDQLEKKDPLLAQFFTVAVMRGLVPGSLLIRRGDLRFCTQEELRRNPPRLLEEIKDGLRRIASDLHDAPFAKGRAELVCSDARRLHEELARPVDAVITSPPYLNGTNYFRNTKIELWFLRELRSKAGLRELRDAAITAGINDVTGRKANGSLLEKVPKSLQQVMTKFEGNSYDPRIPLMVQSYFGEMNRVIECLHSVVARNGTVAIDLGDSCYGDVWVPTDQILAELMEGRGFKQVDRIVLRERQSRDGRKLNQCLQIFKHQAEQKITHLKAEWKHNDVPPGWESFKAQLPHQQGEMAKRNWGHALHSLCSYQGKLKPALAHSLVRSLISGRKKRILDPFAGVGTIPFEAQLMGHIGFGFDISPAALAITRAKVETIDGNKVSSVLTAIDDVVASADRKNFAMERVSAIRFNGPLQSYFHPKTLHEILAVREYFQRRRPVDGASALVFSAMLHILHGNRPYALSRRSHPITPFAPTGATEYRSLVARLRDKVERSLDAIGKNCIRPGRAFDQDATKPWPKEVSDLDAIITSPPFFDSTRFHTANWMRLWFAGWEAGDFQTKPESFVDERQKVSFDIYRPIFRQCAERLKRGGFVLIHLGKSAKCDMATAIGHIAAEYLEPVDAFTESVEHCESHGIRDKGTVTHHQYLLLRSR